MKRARIAPLGFLCGAALAPSLLCNADAGWMAALTANTSNAFATATLLASTAASTHAGGTSGTVNLSWTLPSSWATGYTILRGAAAAGPFSSIGSVGAGVSTYSDTTAAYNTQYYYEIQSTDQRWTATSAIDMALSRPPATGTDATTTTPAALTGANLTALAVADGSAYTTGAWGLTNTFRVAAMTGVACPTAGTCWAVGNGGVIYSSNDAGATWTAESSGTTQNLLGVAFVGTGNGWVVGAHNNIRVTGNGGSTWAAQSSPLGNSTQFNSVSFVDASNGWAVANGGGILHTSNGGATWTAQASGTTQNLTSVDFTDTSHGWAVGAGNTIRVTTNGGGTWSAQASPLGSTSQFNSVLFVDAADGWTVANGGGILHTGDGGATWTAQASGTTQNLTSVDFTDTGNGWAAGAGGTVVHTSNGGGAWSAQTTPGAYQINAVHLFSTSSGIAVDAVGDLLFTQNGGSNWYAGTWQDVVTTFATTMAAGAPVTGATITVTVNSSAVPAAGTETYLLVSPSNGTSWTVFPIANPSTAYATTTVDVSSVVNTQAAVLGLQVRYVEANASTTFTTSLDLIHLNVN